MARYFPAAAMGGKIYPEGIGDRGPWISKRLVYYPENVARVMSAPYPHDALVTEASELLRIVRSSSLPAFKVWIHEALERVAQDLWEGQHRD